MNNSRLPTTISSSAELIKAARTNKLLLAAGVLTIATASVFFILTKYIFISAIFLLFGTVFLGARQLMRKSLLLTSTQNQLKLDTTLAQLENVKKQVSKCKFLENVETEGIQVSQLGEQLFHQYKALVNILSQKFEPSELTYIRYIDSIETTCLSIGENLLHTKMLLENLNLTSSTKTSEWNSQKEQVNQLLQTTTKALTQMASLFNAINQVTTKEIHRDQLDLSLQQIKELTERARAYSRN